MNQSPTSEYIMSLPTGGELNALVEDSINKYVDVDYGCTPHKTDWSRNAVGAVMLMDIIEEHVCEVGVIRLGSDVATIISQMAVVGDEEVKTVVYTGNWIESLCKAYLLHECGFYGDFIHPEFEEKMKNAPKRIIQ